jgi:putative thioredoxin
MSSNPWVIEATEADFEARIIERSREVPVVVDFWAPWCAPCRSLGPLLERLAAEAEGGFVLVKVNVDDAQALAGEFGVSGIPAVFALRDGKVVDQFTGLLPEDELRQFLARLAPSEADQLAAAAAKSEESDPTAAEAGYRAALRSDPRHEAARVGLARVLLRGEGREAEVADLFSGIEVGDHALEADRLRRVLRLREVAHSDSDLATVRAAVKADPEAAEGYHRLGAVLAARGAYADALEALIAAAERDKPLARGPVRELMVDIFHVIGVRSAEADAYRARLQSLLY